MRKSDKREGRDTGQEKQDGKRKPDGTIRSKDVSRRLILALSAAYECVVIDAATDGGYIIHLYEGGKS